MVAKSHTACSGCDQQIFSSTARTVGPGTQVCEVLFSSTKLQECLCVGVFDLLPLNSTDGCIFFNLLMALHRGMACLFFTFNPNIFKILIEIFSAFVLPMKLKVSELALYLLSSL